MHFVIKAGLVVVAAFITSSIFVGQRRDGGVWEAAYRNQSIALTQLLSKDPNNIRARDEWGNSPLHWAAKGGSIQSINLLIVWRTAYGVWRMAYGVLQLLELFDSY